MSVSFFIVELTASALSVCERSKKVFVCVGGGLIISSVRLKTSSVLGCRPVGPEPLNNNNAALIHHM